MLNNYYLNLNLTKILCLENSIVLVAGTCSDTDAGRVDKYGFACVDYDIMLCEVRWGDNNMPLDLDDDDFHSSSMCCVCGGGTPSK